MYVDSTFQRRIKDLESHIFKQSPLRMQMDSFGLLRMASLSTLFTSTFILQGQDDTLENGAGNY